MPQYQPTLEDDEKGREKRTTGGAAETERVAEGEEEEAKRRKRAEKNPVDLATGRSTAGAEPVDVGMISSIDENTYTRRATASSMSALKKKKGVIVNLRPRAQEGPSGQARTEAEQRRSGPVGSCGARWAAVGRTRAKPGRPA